MKQRGAKRMDKAFKESNFMSKIFKENKNSNLNQSNKTKRVYQQQPVRENEEAFVTNSRSFGHPKKIPITRSKI